MLRILQGSGKPYQTGYPRSITQRTKKRQRNRKNPETGTKHDLPQPGTPGKMQIHILRKKRKTTNLLAQQGNYRTSIQTVRPSFPEILPHSRNLPHGKRHPTNEKERSFWSIARDPWMKMEVEKHER
jgi:hypothetical protein